MPTLYKMSDEKQTVDSPTVVIAETTSSSAKPRNTKKYVIIAASAILAAAIILAAILVGMYMFTEAQKEILQYTMTLNNNAKQDVTSDPNENVVQYHVSTSGQESWVVNDFNKDIQLVKIRSDVGGTNCYLSALNRSAAMDPTKMTKPESSDVKGASSLVYVISGTPISDTSFLSKTASDMCKGVSIYWVYPKCMDKSNPDANMTDLNTRSKRQSGSDDPYYEYWTSNGNLCIAGCCKYVCACKLQYQATLDANGHMSCSWYVYDCNGNPSQYVYAYGCYTGPKGLKCPNSTPTKWPTC